MPTASDRIDGHRIALDRERALRRTIFAPDPRLTVSAWADRHRMLPPGSPEGGRWRTRRTPYLREIMDAVSDPGVERIVLMKAARVGYTEGIVGNAVGFWIDQQPAAIMVVQPTVDDAKGWSKEQLDPMLHETPRLVGKVLESPRRSKGNAILYKRFPGGFLVVTGANSAAGLRRRNIENLVADEIDGYPASAKGGLGKEGDPLALAIKRTENYPRRKIILGSTPTVKGASRIEREFELSDQRYFYVACPRCGHWQTLAWRNLRWDQGDPETAHYICGTFDAQDQLTGGCGAVITEDRKIQMVTRGEWRAHRPGRRVRGYRINALYSLLTRWSRLVQQWLEAQGNVELLTVFVNTVLGETWEEDAEQVDHTALTARRETYAAEVPAGVAVLTAGVDVQGDRLEVGTWGHGMQGERWLIRQDVLWGDPGKDEVWDQLDHLRTKAWSHELGLPITIRATAIDSGGHHTDRVYRYCKARRTQFVFAIKGGNTPGAAPVSRASTANKGRVRLFTIGTDALKDIIFSALKTTQRGPHYLHFPQVPEEFFRQLTAEVKRTRYYQGRPIRRYEKRYERNEALDCFVYALAALFILDPLREQLGQILAELKAKAAKRAEAKPAPAPASEPGDSPTPPPARRPSSPPASGTWFRGWRR